MGPGLSLSHPHYNLLTNAPWVDVRSLPHFPSPLPVPPEITSQINYWRSAPCLGALQKKPAHASTRPTPGLPQSWVRRQEAGELGKEGLHITPRRLGFLLKAMRDWWGLLNREAKTIRFALWRKTSIQSGTVKSESNRAGPQAGRTGKGSRWNQSQRWWGPEWYQESKWFLRNWENKINRVYTNWIERV